MERDEASRRVGSALTASLSEPGRSQTWLAKRLGLSQSAVSTWCRGVSMPTVGQVVAIDRALGQPPRTLLEQAGLIEPTSVEEAIRADPSLDDEARGEALATIDALRSATLARRRGTASIDDTQPLPAVVVLPPASDYVVRQASVKLHEAVTDIVADLVGALTQSHGAD